MISFLNFNKPDPQWQEIDAQIYAGIYANLGGSVTTHPHTIQAMENITQLKTRYLGRECHGAWRGAIPLWGKYIVGDKRPLKKSGKAHLFDLGNAEVILPLATDELFSLKGLKGRLISELNAQNIVPCKKHKETLSFARSITKKDFSAKFRYNRRRELAKFTEDGGEVIPFSDLSKEEIAAYYINLFSLRWGKKPKGHELLPEFLTLISPLLQGNLLVMHAQPVAIQLLYMVSSVVGVSVEYINGGVDPAFREYSPGSILSFINIQHAEHVATQAGVPLRFSFGLSDNEYKEVWCNRHPIYRC